MSLRNYTSEKYFVLFIRIRDAPVPVLTGELGTSRTGHPVGLGPSRTGSQSDWLPSLSDVPSPTG